MKKDFLQEKINEIRSIEFFDNDSKINCSFFSLDENCTLEEIASLNEDRDNARFYIISLYYYCVSHETSGGNRYLKANFEYLVLNKIKEKSKITYNNWTIDEIITFGVDFGYPNRTNVSFRVMDIFKNHSEFLPVGPNYGPYSTIINDNLREIITKFKKYSTYQSLENFFLHQKIRSLEEEIKRKIICRITTKH